MIGIEDFTFFEILGMEKNRPPPDLNAISKGLG